jgi:DNA-3-methyladenine glycosylase
VFFAAFVVKYGPMPRLPREFYAQPDTLQLARDLLGKRLVAPTPAGARVSGYIVELEAYLGPADRASHAWNGRRTARTEIMFGPAGRVYVFFIYGMYFQFNVVAGPTDTPHAILIRALEPDEGGEIMQARRPKHPLKNWTSGPGKLCLALGLDRSYNGADLRGPRVWLEEGRAVAPAEIAAGPRIGIDYAGDFVDKPWRFWLRGNPFVSK